MHCFKKFIFILISILIIVNVSAQQSFEPPVVDLLVFCDKYIAGELDNDLGYSHMFLKRDAFRIWGWSGNGNVAYTITDSQNWRGAVITNAVILNLVTDQIVWQGRIVSDEHYDEMTRIDNYRNAYTAFIDEFSSMCRISGIEGVQTGFSPFPAIHNGTSFNVAVKTTLNPVWNADSDITKKILEYTVIAERGSRQKTIGTVNNPESARSVVPCGFFISPFEDRAMVVVAHFEYMLEAECWVSYHFFGCHMTAGF